MSQTHATKPNNSGAGTRRRAYTKSRGGCSSCKAKHLRCDEVKPKCGSCTKKGVSCCYQKNFRFVVFDGQSGSEGEVVDGGGSGSGGKSPGGRSGGGGEPSPSHNSNTNKRRDALAIEYSSEQTTPTAIVSPPAYQLQKFHPRTPLPAPLIPDSTKLIHHYFTQICAVYSAYDSPLNPFRTAVRNLYDSSAPIYYAMQSMSAAHLSNSAPRAWGVKGLVLQQRAYGALRAELGEAGGFDEGRVMLVLLLLGLTTCWHERGDLGLVHLRAARVMFWKCRAGMVGSSPTGGEDEAGVASERFFAQALVYWEMVMSFASSEPVPVGELFVGEWHELDGAAPLTPPGEKRSIRPHPWAGVAPGVQMLFAEVGKLFRYRRQTSGLVLHPQMPEHVLDSARSLKKALLRISLPTADEILPSGDTTISPENFVLIAEATRSTGLLMLHRVFPTLRRRQSADDDSDPCPILATKIVHGLCSIRASEGAQFIQLLELNCAAAELRLSQTATVEVQKQTLHARDAALGRFDELSRRLPAKPIRQIMQLLVEVWRLGDAGRDVFWMDVMATNGWQTFMG